MASALLDKRGTVKLPDDVKQALDLHEGDQVEFRLRGDGVAEMIRAGEKAGAEPEIDLLSLRSAVQPQTRGVTLDEMERAIRQGAW